MHRCLSLEALNDRPDTIKLCFICTVASATHELHATSQREPSCTSPPTLKRHPNAIDCSIWRRTTTLAMKRPTLKPILRPTSQTSRFSLCGLSSILISLEISVHSGLEEVMQHRCFIVHILGMTVFPCFSKVTFSYCPKSLAEPKPLACHGRNGP